MKWKKLFIAYRWFMDMLDANALQRIIYLMMHTFISVGVPRNNTANTGASHMIRKLLHSLPVTTSCAVPAFGINGPHVFEEGKSRVPVNSA
jgi:hypothetical protein